VLIVLSGCGSKTDTDDEISYDNWLVHIEYDGDSYDIAYLYDEDIVMEYKNNDEVGEVTVSYYAHRMTLPETEEVNDLSSAGIISDNVWEADEETGAAYLNYLETQGYEVKFRAETYKFVEVYMFNSEKSAYKRVIITDSYLVSTDADEIPELNIKNYIFS
jgi:hypothetical protein